MASGDTRTQQYLGIAANGNRADLPSETCCETRTQTLTREVAERVIGLDEEVQELKNNPDVVDIVETYQDLEDYDTSTLTDNDIIRVLTDETHNGNSTYYRLDKSTDTWTFIGEIPMPRLTIERVSGATPTIVGQEGHVYICGEVTSLNFTPSATGLCEVIFTSGTTPTNLTIPNTVMMPDWFVMEANKTYEISVLEGTYGAVMSWS